LKALPAPKTLKELCECNRLIGDDRNTTLIDAMAKYGIVVSRDNFVFRTDGDLFQLAALRAGLGIGICQEQIAARDNKLVRVLPEVGISLEAWIVMHEDLKRVWRIRSVFDHLVGSIGSYYNQSFPSKY
jgi:DNA-binding transcriptional LysR family regulator